jgi:hypothetical protein
LLIEVQPSVVTDMALGCEGISLIVPWFSLTAEVLNLILKMTVFWDVVPHRLVEVY